MGTVSRCVCVCVCVSLSVRVFKLRGRTVRACVCVFVGRDGCHVRTHAVVLRIGRVCVCRGRMSRAHMPQCGVSRVCVCVCQPGQCVSPVTQLPLT